MRILNNTAAESCGLATSRSLTISANAQAFRLLSDTLYSDKISSILRELGSNAVDSHQAADRPDLPFEVKLPNSLDTRFYLRDWGIGLDEQEVYDVYLSYFASSKQGSNEFIGGFGLGSKSPFAYTDTFSLIAVKNGVKRTFLVYLDESGPKVSKVDETAADPAWPSGVEVSFAVKPADFAAFSEKAENTYKWFAVPPVVKGATLDLTPLKGKRYSVATLLSAPIASGMLHVRVGGCVYVFTPKNLDLDVISLNHAIGYPSGTNTEILYRLLLEAPIGSVALTGSREQLSFDSTGHTRNTLLTLMRQTIADVRTEMSSAIRDMTKTPFDRVKTALKAGRAWAWSLSSTAKVLWPCLPTGDAWVDGALERIAHGDPMCPPAVHSRVIDAVRAEQSTNVRGAYVSWTQGVEDSLNRFRFADKLYVGTVAPVGKLRDTLRQLCLTDGNLLYIQVVPGTEAVVAAHLGGLTGLPVPVASRQALVSDKAGQAAKPSAPVSPTQQVAQALAQMPLTSLDGSRITATDLLDMSLPPVLVMVHTEASSKANPEFDLAPARFSFGHPVVASLAFDVPVWSKHEFEAACAELLPGFKVVQLSRSDANKLSKLSQLCGGLDSFNVRPMASELYRRIRQNTPIELGWYVMPPSDKLDTGLLYQMVRARGLRFRVLQSNCADFAAKADLLRLLAGHHNYRERILSALANKVEFRFEDFSDDSRQVWLRVADVLSKAPLLVASWDGADTSPDLINDYLKLTGIL